MKIEFTAPKGQRLHRYFLWLEVSGLWWSDELRKWVPYESGIRPLSSGANLKTLKAALSHVRRHADEIGSRTVTVSNRYAGHDVKIHLT